MKLKFLHILVITVILLYGYTAHAIFYGLCCPEKCPEGQEAKEVSSDNCDCTCTKGKDTQNSNDGNKVCCEGAINVVTGEVVVR